MWKFIKNHRNLFLGLFIVYCITLSAIIILTTIPYNSTYENNNDKIISFNDYWKVYVDGKLDSNSVTLPYKIEDENSKIIDIYNTLPKTQFRTSVLVFSVYQKNIAVYVDDDLIYESEFEPKGINCQTPGSGRFNIQLPEKFEGKTVHIQYERVVKKDVGPIGSIDIINGRGNSQLFIVNGSIILFIITSVFMLGVLLVIISTSFKSSGIDVLSLVFLALFDISSIIWIWCNSKMLQFLTSNLILIHGLEYISFYLMPVTLWAFLWLNWKSYSKFSFPMLTIEAGFFALALTLKVLKICDFFALLKIFHLLAFINIVVLILMATQVFKSKSFFLKLYYFGFLFLCIGGIIDIIRFYTDYHIHSSNVFFVIGILFLGICIILSFTYSAKDKLKERIERDLYKMLAYTDALTKINNRLMFEKDLDNTQENIETYDNIIIIILDVNNFKIINDNYGHLQGDEMLKIIANELVNVFGDVGKCYRIGGDEFSLIITNRNIEEMTTLLQILDEKLESKEFDFPVSVSYGVTQYDKLVHNGLQDVFKSSDDNMYANKKRRKEI